MLYGSRALLRPVMLLGVALSAPSSAQQQHPYGLRMIDAGPCPVLASEDFDGDGRVDLAAILSQGGAPMLSVRLQQAGGALGPAVTQPAPRYDLLEARDLDGDGDVDLLGAAEDAGSLDVLHGRGAGRFDPPAPAFRKDGLVVRTLSLGDVDGDALPDIVLLYSWPGCLSLRNRGDGTFDELARLDLGGTGAWDVVLRDVDDDGLLDVLALVMDGSDALLSLSRGRGDGRFLAPELQPAPWASNLMATGDLDASGTLDVLLVARTNLWTKFTPLLGDGDGGFGTGTTVSFDELTQPFGASARLDVLDIDVDGVADALMTAWLHEFVPNDIPALIPEQLVLLRGEGGAQYEPGLLDIGTTVASPAFADVTDDGLPDLVFAGHDHNAPRNVYVLPGPFLKTLDRIHRAALGHDVRALALAGGGAADAQDVVLRFEQGLRVASVGPDGSVTASGTLEVGTPRGRAALATGDFDGDGHIDVVIDRGTGPVTDTVEVLFAAPGGGFDGATELVPEGIFDALVDDFDGDGALDVAVMHGDSLLAPLSGTTDWPIGVFGGHGDGTFAPERSHPSGGGGRALACGDVDGDGENDLVVSTQAPGSVGLLAGLPGLDFAAVVSTPLAGAPTDVRLGDLDLDGDLDAVVLRPDLQDVAVLQNHAGRLVPATAQPVLASPARLRLADVEQDGRLDLVVAHAVDVQRNVSVAAGRGDGTFDDPKAFLAESTPVDVVAADIDGDGFDDLLLGHEADEDLLLLLNRADGWADIGHPLPLPVIAPQPRLAGRGDAVADGTVALVVGGIPAGTPALLVVGLSTAYAPFAGGTLAPSPDALLPILPGALQVRWPDDLPPGTAVTFQVWFEASEGAGATNALVTVAR